MHCPWVRRERWPTLDRTEQKPDLDAHLHYRLGGASWMLQYLLAEWDELPEVLAEPPDPDSPEFLQWLLIDVWQAIRVVFLEYLAAELKADLSD